MCGKGSARRYWCACAASRTRSLGSEKASSSSTLVSERLVPNDAPCACAASSASTSVWLSAIVERFHLSVVCRCPSTASSYRVI
eukprot:scaffold140107_cov115-Phaeocystis_antarctica.AAC.2